MPITLHHLIRRKRTKNDVISFMEKYKREVCNNVRLPFCSKFLAVCLFEVRKEYDCMEIVNLFDSGSISNENDYSLFPERTFENVIDHLNDLRDNDCNKGTFGTLACICGSYGMAGAAMLCGSAAVTCGAGIVKMILPKSIYPIAATNLWEAVFVPMPESDNGTFRSDDCSRILEEAESSSAAVIGCGLRVTPDTEQIVCEVLKKCSKTIILDADGINCIAKHIDVLEKRTYPTILTPHPGEMSRLCGLSVSEIQANREAAAEDFAKRFGCTLVLKGVGTVITNGTKLIVNPTGNGCLAKGGSGDVLAGIIGSLVCQGIGEFEASASGVYLHGYAADECIDEFACSCVNARDIINTIKYLM